MVLSKIQVMERPRRLESWTHEKPVTLGSTTKQEPVTMRVIVIGEFHKAHLNMTLFTLWSEEGKKSGFRKVILFWGHKEVKKIQLRNNPKILCFI